MHQSHVAVLADITRAVEVDSAFASCPELTSQSCVACRTDVCPLSGTGLAALLQQLANGWRLANEHHLKSAFRFKTQRR